MQITNNAPFKNPYLDSMNKDVKAKETTQTQSQDNKTQSLDSMLKNSSVEVSISMNAQIVLFSMNAQDLGKENTNAQKNILDFLSGKTLEDGSSLADIGYEGKPITELSQSEAQALVSEDGFFGVTQTSDRIADFALSFSDDPEIIKEALEGIKKGFEQAEKMWGGELPDISYETQDRTIKLIEERLAELEGTNTNEESELS